MSGHDHPSGPIDVLENFVSPVVPRHIPALLQKPLADAPQISFHFGHGAGSVVYIFAQSKGGIKAATEAAYPVSLTE
jgi:hypothetical protein